MIQGELTQKENEIKELDEIWKEYKGLGIALWGQKAKRKKELEEKLAQIGTQVGTTEPLLMQKRTELKEITSRMEEAKKFQLFYLPEQEYMKRLLEKELWH